MLDHPYRYISLDERSCSGAVGWKEYVKKKWGMSRDFLMASSHQHTEGNTHLTSFFFVASFFFFSSVFSCGWRVDVRVAPVRSSGGVEASE